MRGGKKAAWEGVQWGGMEGAGLGKESVQVLIPKAEVYKGSQQSVLMPAGHPPPQVLCCQRCRTPEVHGGRGSQSAHAAMVQQVQLRKGLLKLRVFWSLTI